MARKQGAPARRTVADLLANKVSKPRDLFTDEQREQVAEALRVNDSGLGQVSFDAIYGLLCDDYGYTGGRTKCRSMVLAEFKRASWSRP